MSSRNNRFECRWRPSRGLLAAYFGVQFLALGTLWSLDLPFAVRLALAALCLMHAAWCLPRQILLSAPDSLTALRLGPGGWAVHTGKDGWQPVRLMPDSLALPFLVVLRIRPTRGAWWQRRLTRTLCLPRDTMPADSHRRLRLRLKFGRSPQADQ